ncbi:DUF4013 domain-containing protein [Halococcus sp. PRR34]|uniref:DUF4013 domain-containing protein n=1 Tax=Halococcus sp. PRR34 TaxID=3020830 RepID=UPI00235ED848|nr:DUF4013 domain-containing protein [Halococcus sp. PRR34]
MDVDIETLARYPMESDDWIITVLIGGFALLFSFLIVPWFVVSGYLVRAIRSGMEHAEHPPVFDEWGDLLKEGVVAGIIGFIYQLIPLVVFGVFVGGSVLALLTGSDAGAGLGFLGFFGGLFFWWILALAFGYVGFAGVANYARKGTFGAGFDFGIITDVVTSREYLIAWAYVIGLNIVVGLIVTVLNIVPILGGIVGVFVGFYALIIAAWLWGDGFAAATDGRQVPESSPPEDPSASFGQFES